ncbi:hypothetical protein CcCBS67573_g05064 [Chytriomyces confervae]|uniref:SH3 domain-containing protein n=1 Tax=Chytriomyces confervae TaxID=246404 RepID=A0A507FBL2_9FUNG|nr:hypothetical protein HDU80_010256 [Chytriomyces hyalinus]TPX73673.1 hypothetical protein CcCBS67573_g05064 [Chytriomyces confervae]
MSFVVLVALALLTATGMAIPQEVQALLRERRAEGVHRNMHKSAVDTHVQIEVGLSILLPSLICPTPGLLIESQHQECVPVLAASICNPLGAGSFINATAVSAFYRTPITNAADWETALLASTSGSTAGSAFFERVFGCGRVDDSPVPFHLTHSCARDLSALSAGCNVKSGVAAAASPSVCASTCARSSNALGAVLFGDGRACASVASSDPVFDLRAQALRSDFCSKETTSCVEAVETDLKSCGFAGNLDAAHNYCTQYSHNPPPCCLYLKNEQHIANTKSPLNIVSKFIKASKDMKAESASTPAAAANNDAPPSVQSTSGLSAFSIVGIVLSVLFLLGLAAGGFYYYRNRVDYRIQKRRSTRRPSQGYFNNSSNNITSRQAGPYSGGRIVVSPVATNINNKYSKIQNDESSPPTSSTTTSPAAVKPSQSINASSIFAAQQLKSNSPARPVILEYTAVQGDELTLKIGDMVQVVELFDDGWVKGTALNSGNVGMFPAACIGV